MQNKTEQQQMALCSAWLEKVVIGMNLCPFAKPVARAGGVHYAITQQSHHSSLLTFFVEQLALIAQAKDTDIATSLIIYPSGLDDFYEYLDFLAECERLLDSAGHSGVLQLASFHPQYLFAGVDADDLSHWSNRSPYPIIHIIREQQMSEVLARHPNPDAIPARNIAFLRELGSAELIARFPPFADYALAKSES